MQRALQSTMGVNALDYFVLAVFVVLCLLQMV
jgi:hypothetical protein